MKVYYRWCAFFGVVLNTVLQSKAVPIVGGDIVKSVDSISRYPYMVSLQDVYIQGTDYRTKRYRHFCGGVLISKRWILTAAHCVWRKRMRQIVAFIGYENIANIEKLEPYGIERAQFIYFQPINYRNDIVLLLLKRPYKSTLSPDLQFGQLLPQSIESVQEESCRIIGYGATEDGGLSQKQLYEAQVNIISHQQCRNIIGHVWAPQEGATSVCALGDSQDSCQGDSGGPLICPHNGRDYIYGLVSHGLTCGLEGVPSIYTLTHPYYDWMQLLIHRNH